MLKSGIRLHGIYVVDQVWLTCCSLHNMLLEVDGFDKLWLQGVSTDNQNGYNELPFAIEKLKNPGMNSTIRGLSGMGYGTDVTKAKGVCSEDNDNEVEDPILDENNSIKVNSLTMKQFRNRLITHFNINFHKDKVVCPKRND